MLKVVLVNPARGDEYPQPPMGLALLAAVLEREGYEAAIVDANALDLSPEEVISRADGADVVGLTAMTPSIDQAVTVARALKRASPQRPVILGGAHVTLLPEETLAGAAEIDYLVRGEGEEALLTLLEAIAGGRLPQDIPGVSYRQDGQAVHNPRADTYVDIENLPPLAYHLLPLKAYRPHPPHGQASPFAAIITSRGCPYRCSYCSKPIFGYKFRGQSAVRVVDEIARLVMDFGVREIAIYDDVFTLNKRRAQAICEEILKRGLKFHWSCESRVNLVDEDLLSLMKRAGCYSIAYGIESAAPEILARLDKDADPEDAARAVRQTRAAGVQAIGYFMIGSPRETPETIRRTIDFARELKLDYAQFSITVPFPGTNLYQTYLAEGHTDPLPWENFAYAGIATRDMPVFTSEKLRREDLGKWQARAYREFYLRPAYFWQRLRQIKNWESLTLNFKGLKLLAGSLNLPRRKK
jgi:radical SAM superfamily enzyme YgiQ (UPF0313 family)